jgi:hypothetical protein
MMDETLYNIYFKDGVEGQTKELGSEIPQTTNYRSHMIIPKVDIPMLGNGKKA